MRAAHDDDVEVHGRLIPAILEPFEVRDPPAQPFELRTELVPLVALGLAIGYLAHVAGDACTPGGVALWAPLSARRRWLLPAPARIPTGSLRELAATTLLAAISLGAIVVLAG